MDARTLGEQMGPIFLVIGFFIIYWYIDRNKKIQAEKEVKEKEKKL